MWARHGRPPALVCYWSIGGLVGESSVSSVSGLCIDMDAWRREICIGKRTAESASGDVLGFSGFDGSSLAASSEFQWVSPFRG